MTESAYREFYEHYYRRIYMGWEPEVLFENQLSRGRSVKRWLARNANLSFGAGDKVIEIGAGAGGILAAFAEDGCLVTGCDYDDRFLAFGRDRGIELVQGDAGCLNKSGQARLIILCHVFEHMTSPVKELQRIREMLVPEGFLWIQVPGVSFELMHYHRGGHKLFDFLDYAQNAHTYHFDRRDLLRLVTTAGFECASSDDQVTALFRQIRHHRELELDPPSCSSADADASLAQLRRLREMEFRRTFTRWIENPIRAFIPLTRHAFRSALGKSGMLRLSGPHLRRHKPKLSSPGSSSR